MLLKVWRDIERQDQSQTVWNDKEQTLTDTVTQVWCAQYDTIAVEPLSATTASAGGATVPNYASGYMAIGGNYGFTFTSALAQRNQQSPFVIDVQVTLTRLISFKPDDKDKWAVSINIDGQEYTQDAHKDMNGNPCQNSAGAPFDPTLKRTYNDEVINVKYKTLTPPDLSTMRGYVNSDAVTFTIDGYSKSFGYRQLKLKNGSISTTYVDGTAGNAHVWDVSLQFLARKDQFIDTVVDEGYYERDQAVQSPNLCGGGGAGGPPAGKKMNFLDKFSEQVDAPVRLDGHGQELTVGGGAAIYLCFPLEPETALAGLFSGI